MVLGCQRFGTSLEPSRSYGISCSGEYDRRSFLPLCPRLNGHYMKINLCGRPWAFAIAVWGGALGSLALLLRKRWARAVLLISLIGIIVQMTHSFFFSNNFEVYGPDKMIMPIMVIVFGVLLVLFARMAINRNWFFITENDQTHIQNNEFRNINI